MKIDVEGYERKVVKGAINTIKKYRPVLQLECWKNLKGEIIKVDDKDTVLNDLKKLDYQIEHVGSKWDADFLAIPE